MLYLIHIYMLYVIHIYMLYLPSITQYLPSVELNEYHIKMASVPQGVYYSYSFYHHYYSYSFYHHYYSYTLNLRRVCLLVLLLLPPLVQT